MKHSISNIVHEFISEKPSRTNFGNYRIEDDTLVFRAQSSEDAPRWWGQKADFEKACAIIGRRIRETDGRLTRDGKTVLLESLTEKSQGTGLKISFHETNIVARKIKTKTGVYVIGNSSVLPLIGRTVSYGHVSLNNSETEIQASLKRRGILMLPFGNVSFWGSFELLAQGSEASEDGTIPAHSVRVFRLDSRTFLSDIDRRERQHGHSNPFITEVPSHVTTIAEAYESLKPRAVLDAERRGLDVKRQGQWFFIPSKAPKIPKLTVEERLLILAGSTYALDKSTISYLLDGHATFRGEGKRDAEKLLERVPRPRSLPGTPGDRSQDATQVITIDGVLYCKGVVSSARRADLKLGDWHIAVLRKSMHRKGE